MKLSGVKALILSKRKGQVIFIKQILTDVSINFWDIGWHVEPAHQITLKVIKTRLLRLLEMLPRIRLAVLTIHGLVHLLLLMSLPWCGGQEHLWVLLLVPLMIILGIVWLNLLGSLGLLKLGLLIIENSIVLGACRLHHIHWLRLLRQKSVAKLVRVGQLTAALLI